MSTPKIVKTDPWLAPFEEAINNRINHYHNTKSQLHKYFNTLDNLASAYKYFGVHSEDDEQVYREWAPNAQEVYLVGAFCDWKRNSDYKFKALNNGVWELRLKEGKLGHGDLFKLHIFWEGGDGMRLPAYVRRVLQDEETKGFDAQLWMPKETFNWTDENFKPSVTPLLIYEAHIGMSSEKEEVSSFIDFKNYILPRIIKAGYNCIQFMAIQEHPYYGSFGYHVSNFFAVSSRFGTPEELKELINEAHKNGITVIMDIVHSHAVKNELEGIAKLDGTSYQYFHDGGKGDHPAWDSKCFNYGKNEVMQFLLSNCKYWLEEFHFDGYRFDGITSMLYTHHGLEYSFSSYGDYYNGTEDTDAMTYLTLANEVIHQVKPGAITVAEDMSGLPGLAAPIDDGGLGFDYRLSMGVPDFWIKLIKEQSDENWNVAQIFHELSQHREGEKVVSYAESHDQALVGDKTILFRLVDKEMYDKMDLASQSLIIDRGIALHKMIRLATMTTSSGGYLNFMGNEFGHPEWIDFPREGNNWSFKHARRQWNLMDHKDLKFQWLSNFDKAMIDLANIAFSIPDEPCYSVMANEVDQVMCYKRGNYYMVFNFSPTNSYTDYGISVEPGKYNVVLSSDNESFGGYENVDEQYLHMAEKVLFQDNHYQIKLYIPSRTAIVLKHSAPKRVH